ncbi:MAG: hypothetical protein ACK4M7_02285 [Burkholderiales bacterium]
MSGFIISGHQVNLSSRSRAAILSAKDANTAVAYRSYWEKLCDMFGTPKHENAIREIFNQVRLDEQDRVVNNTHYTNQSLQKVIGKFRSLAINKDEFDKSFLLSAETRQFLKNPALASVSSRASVQIKLGFRRESWLNRFAIEYEVGTVWLQEPFEPGRHFNQLFDPNQPAKQQQHITFYSLNLQKFDPNKFGVLQALAHMGYKDVQIEECLNQERVCDGYVKYRIKQAVPKRLGKPCISGCNAFYDTKSKYGDLYLTPTKLNRQIRQHHLIGQGSDHQAFLLPAYIYGKLELRIILSHFRQYPEEEDSSLISLLKRSEAKYLDDMTNIKSIWEEISNSTNQYSHILIPQFLKKVKHKLKDDFTSSLMHMPYAGTDLIGIAKDDGCARLKFYPLCKELDDLHNQDIFHRDIKLKNMGEGNGDGIVKLFDTVWLTKVTSKAEKLDNRGTTQHMHYKIVREIGSNRKRRLDQNTRKKILKKNDHYAMLVAILGARLGYRVFANKITKYNNSELEFCGEVMDEYEDEMLEELRKIMRTPADAAICLQFLNDPWANDLGKPLAELLKETA